VIHAALVACLIICINCAYAVAALAAANRYGVGLSFRDNGGFAIAAAGTAVELAILIHGNVLAAPMLVIAFGAAVIAAACDAVCGYVFDAVTLPCLAALAATAALLHTFQSFALGALACGGFLALLYAMTYGRGIGLGDVKLACCIGGAAGAVKGLSALGVAFVLGAVYAVYLLVMKRGHFGREVRFAPYLAAGMAAMALHGAFV
jgi:prepilin signal peptidase PulO-like enzyme (type II secretory pathway)